MSRKNFKVATAQDGKTPTQDSKHTFVVTDKAPTGKVKTMKDKEQVRKEREEEYKNRRVSALKRRAKRLGLNEEQTNVKVKELLAQLDTPNSYDVLIFYNPNNRKLVEEALKNEGLTTKIMTDTYLFIEADQETLATLREIIPPGSKIHPYTKKKPSVLPKAVQENKKPKQGGSPHSRLGGGKEKRKRYNVARMKKANRAEFKAKVKNLKSLWKAKKKASGTTVQLKPKKSSQGSKKASTTMKKAA